jgi:nucleoside-diphosphate-sugar epimerase
MIISILGCGWVGMPLAHNLVQAGYTVKGSTTRATKQATINQLGAQAYHLQLTPELAQDPADFFACDVLVVTMPPPRSSEDLNEHDYLTRQAEVVLEHLDAASHLIVTSSTSVYAKNNQTVTEDDDTPPESARGQALRGYEQAFQKRPVTILRLAGLFGKDRQPGRFLAGRQDLPGGASPVNMVHGDDVVAAIERVIETYQAGQDVSGTFNICADTHPTRASFFQQAARNANLPLPTFSGEDRPYAQIDNQTFKRRFDFSYHYPDVLAALLV